MIWLTWRQFRIQALTALVILVAAAIYLIITGLSMRHTYTADLGSCQAQNNCETVLNDFQDYYSKVLKVAGAAVIVAPALIGIFWGAPLIAREFETGTHRLLWTQSVSRSRWLSAKLVGVGLATVLVAGLLSLLLTWWASPLDLLGGGRFAPTQFDSRNIAPVGYAAFAFVLGTTTGLFIRRTIPAMAVTLAIFIAVQIFVPADIRPNLLTPTVRSVAVDQATMNQVNSLEVNGDGSSAVVHIYGLPVPDGAWLQSVSALETSAGKPIGFDVIQNCVNNVPDGGFGVVGACLAPFDLHIDLTYAPAADYWPLQWYETGIFVALAGLLAGSCFWWVRRRQD